VGGVLDEGERGGGDIDWGTYDEHAHYQTRSSPSQ